MVATTPDFVYNPGSQPDGQTSGVTTYVSSPGLEGSSYPGYKLSPSHSMSPR